MATPKITPLPEMPNRLAGAAEFAQKADAALGALPPMVGQINTVIDFVDGRATAAAASATVAENSANTANARANAAAASATAANQSVNEARAIAASMGEDAGLPLMAGNAGKPLIVNENEQSVDFRNLPVDGGGTGASTPAAARANLGIGTNAIGNRTVSTSAPTGGAHGDLWFQV